MFLQGMLLLSSDHISKFIPDYISKDTSSHFKEKEHVVDAHSVGLNR
jgi:hypothetical protein